MRSRAFPFVALALLAMFFQRSAKADSLTGLTVTGSLNSYYFPDITPFPHSAVIGTGVEFQGVIHDIYSQTWNISANFTDSSLIVSVSSPDNFANVFGPTDLIALSFSGFPADLTGFPLTDFTCACLPIFGNYNSLTTNSYSGSTLNLDFSALLNGQTYTFSEEPPPSTVPEPSTLLLFSTGLTSAVCAFFRRRASGIANG